MPVPEPIPSPIGKTSPTGGAQLRSMQQPGPSTFRW